MEYFNDNRDELYAKNKTCPHCGGAASEYELTCLEACYKCAHEAGDC